MGEKFYQKALIRLFWWIIFFALIFWPDLLKIFSSVGIFLQFFRTTNFSASGFMDCQLTKLHWTLWWGESPSVCAGGIFLVPSLALTSPGRSTTNNWKWQGAERQKMEGEEDNSWPPLLSFIVVVIHFFIPSVYVWYRLDDIRPSIRFLYIYAWNSNVLYTRGHMRTDGRTWWTNRTGREGVGGGIEMKNEGARGGEGERERRKK